MCIVRLTHREFSSSSITEDQIDYIREMPAPQNRTHNTRLINNARHKNHEVVYAQNFIPTKILDYQFFEIPRNIITRNFLCTRYL